MEILAAAFPGRPAAHSGAYGAFFHSTGSPGLLSQDLATISGATYTLSFWLGHRQWIAQQFQR